MRQMIYWLFCTLFAPRQWTGFVSEGEWVMRRWNGKGMERRPATEEEAKALDLDWAIK